MERYGSDRPDLRYSIEIHDWTAQTADLGFRMIDAAVADGGRVRGLRLEGYTVLVVPYFEWRELKSHEDQMLYLWSLGRRGARELAAHDRLHARGRGHPSPERQRCRATPSSDELRPSSYGRDLTVGAAGRAAEGGQVAAQGRAGRRALPCFNK